jgi:Papain family cysteine protease
MPGRGLIPTDQARRLIWQDVSDHPTIRTARASLKGAADMSPYAPRVLDQGQTSTCWAHSAVTLMFVRMFIRLGGAPQLMSPLFFSQLVYAAYRAQNNPTGSLPALVDDGAQLDDAIVAFSRWGCSPFGGSGDTDVPQDGVWSELSVRLVEQASGRRFGGPYDITPGSAAVETVAACLEADTPVWLGGLVGSAVENLAAGQVEQPMGQDDPSAGGHARAILGYRTVSGKPQFLLRNSWGTGWCDGGNSWATADVIATAWSLIPFEVD